MTISTRWRDQAACAGLGLDLFMDDSPLGPGAARYLKEAARRAQVRTARGWCAGCPVRDVCLEDAIARKDRHTIRGGLTVRERASLVNAREAESEPDDAAVAA